uniref:Protein kinase domain-containing protein n=1 Tax=Paramoeba aestuarina TaxID=180227 RepID=A0A7S4PBE7_9EUKA
MDTVDEKIDKIDEKLDQALQQQQHEPDIQIIEWDTLTLEDEEANSGSYGTVHQGKWGSRQVAVKVLNVGTVGKRVMKELTNEAKTHCCLRHPNIIFFYGIVLSPEPAIVMEWAAPSLSFFLEDWDDDDDIPWRQRWTMAHQIAKGMAFVHSNNILHHDLRASNVLIGPKGSRFCRLCDFGLSRAKQQSTKNSKQKSGNPFWLSPEYYENPVRGYNASCDVFSFAVVMFEIATYGKLPFEDHQNINVQELYAKGMRNEAIEDNVPKEYKEMIELSWHQNPMKRPSFQQICEMISSSGVADPEITI